MKVFDQENGGNTEVGPRGPIGPKGEDGSGGGGGAVDSVFGRDGVVEAESGDYTTDLVDETASRVYVSPAEKSEIGVNTTKISYTDAAAVSANTAKISYDDQAAVSANTAKISYDDQAAVSANTAKISYTDAAAVSANTAKISYTDAAAVSLNTAKISYTDAVLVAQHTTDIGDNATDITGKEDSLPTVPTDGYVLSSTIAGVRSWVEQSGGGGGGSTTPLIAAQYNDPTGGQSLAGAVDVDVLITIDTADFEDTGYSNVGGVITVDDPGRYRLDSFVSITGVTSNYRWEGRISLYKNTSTLLKAKQGGYIRSSTGHNSTFLDIDHTFDLLAGDTLQIMVARTNTVAGNATTVADESQIILTKMEGGEPALGNPLVDDYVLSSKIDGTRSWVANAGGGGGAVDSVFGRTGVVEAVSGDYDASEITETGARVFVSPAEKSEIAVNTGKISYTDAAAVSANTAKISFSTADSDAVDLNTAKVTYDDQVAVGLNTAKVTYDDQVAVGLNTAKVTYDDQVAVGLNTAKISYTDAAAVSANSAKISFTTADSDAVDLNTAKISFSTADSDAVDLNTAKISYTDSVAVGLNTAKISYTDAVAVGLNTAKVTYDDQVAVGLNTAKISYTDAAAVSANTAKISYTDAAAVSANSAKISFSTADSDAVDLNTAKVTYDDQSAVSANTAKISYTDAAAVSANTAKISYTDAAAVSANTAKVSYDDAALVAGHTTDIGDNATDILGKEDGLPAVSNDGDVLSSTIAGVRSWITPSGGGGSSDISFIEVRDTVGGLQLGQVADGTSADMLYDTVDHNTDTGQFALSTNAITITNTESKKYLFEATTSWFGTVQRWSVRMAIHVNGSPVWEIIGGYIRSSNNHFEMYADISKTLDLVNGDVVKLLVTRNSGNGTGNSIVSVANKSLLRITSKVGAAGVAGPAGPAGTAFDVETKAANFTAENAKLYLVDTNAARTVTMPSSPSNGDYFRLKDKTGLGNTNNITLARAGSESIEGVAANYIMQTDFGSLSLVSDGTDWYLING